MTEKPENPDAFPISTIDGFTQHGMTLRDWFAGQAMVGLLIARSIDVANGNHDHKDTSRTASEALEYADALLTERSKGERS